MSIFSTDSSRLDRIATGAMLCWICTCLILSAHCPIFAASRAELEEHRAVCTQLCREMAVFERRNAQLAKESAEASSVGQWNQAILLGEDIVNGSESTWLDLSNELDWEQDNDREHFERVNPSVRAAHEKELKSRRSVMEGLANLYIANRYPRKAIEMASRCLDAGAEDALVLQRLRGSAKIWSGNVAAGVAELNSLEPRPSVQIIIAEAEIAGGQYSQAIQRIKGIIELTQGRQSYPLYCLAIAEAMNAAVDSARVAFTKAVAVAKQENASTVFDQDYYYCSGILKLYSKDYHGACTELEKAAQMSRVPIGDHGRGRAMLFQLFAAMAKGDRETSLDLTEELVDLFQAYPLLQQIYAVHEKEFPNIAKVSIKDANRPVANVWLLAVGVSQFADSGINLRYAGKDAQDFANHMKGCGVPSEHIKVLVDSEATRANVLSAIGDEFLHNGVGPDDAVIIYLSTHGTPGNKDIGGMNYVVTHDTQKLRLYSTAIPMQKLLDLTSTKLRSDRILFVLDTCYSGGLGLKNKEPCNISAQRISDFTGQIVLSSSTADEKSWESVRSRNGVFTEQLLSNLRASLASNAQPLRTLFGAVQRAVLEEVKTDHRREQHPQVAGAWGSNDALPTKTLTNRGNL